MSDRTTTLSDTLNILNGTVVGLCIDRHLQPEFIRRLNAAERTAPVGNIIPAIVDNFAAHKEPKAAKWLSDKRRAFHFTPASAFRINAVGSPFVWT